MSFITYERVDGRAKQVLRGFGAQQSFPTFPERPVFTAQELAPATHEAPRLLPALNGLGEMYVVPGVSVKATATLLPEEEESVIPWPSVGAAAGGLILGGLLAYLIL